MTRPLLLIAVFLFTISCKNESNTQLGEDISNESSDIIKGEELFVQHCSTCHNFKNAGIGPSLNGLTHTMPVPWIKKFIRNNQDLLLANDDRAVKITNEFAGMMPNFEFLNAEELDALLAYLHTFNEKKLIVGREESPLEDPIPDSLKTSNLVAELQFIAQVTKTSQTAPTARINKIGCEPNSNRIFINDLRGFLYEIKGSEISQVLSIKELENDFMSEPGLATGFGSFAFHPEFDSNGLLYTTHTEPADTKPADFSFADSIPKGLQWVLKERKIKNDGPKFSVIMERELLRMDFMGTIHGMQEIAFNPKAKKGSPDFGKLYIATGDGSSIENGFKEVVLHHAKGVWSSILRIDPLGSNSGNGYYGIPEDNPFVGKKDFANEVWAYGFRNPNKLAWDNFGNLYTGDIGHNQIEELNKVEPGNFYGWPFREGSFIIYPDEAMDKIYPLKDDDGSLNVTYPVLQYDHSEGAAISGGYFTEDNLYVCGDIPTGYTWIGDVVSKTLKELPVQLQGKTIDFKEVTNSGRVDLRFGQDCDGTIYFFTKADGKIYKMAKLSKNTHL